MTLHRPAPAHRPECRTVVEPACQFRRVHRGDPRRRELDRQRHPVESATDLHDRCRVRRASTRSRDRSPQHVPRTTAPRPHSPPLRARSSSAGAPTTAPVPPAHRRARALHDSSRGSRRPPDTPRGSLDQVRDALEEMLTVVDHQQQLLRAEELGEGLFQGLARRGRSPRTPPRTHPPPHRGRAPAPTRPATHPHGTRARLPPQLGAPNGSCRPHPPPSTSRPALRRAPSRPNHLPIATNERTRLQRQVPRERIDRRQRRELAD